jgi:hypothetical protein
MFPAATKAGGMCQAMPDVCLTPAPPAPPIPVPYPNMGMLNQADKTSKKVLIENKDVITLKSEIPRSMGDEAGTNGGVVSGKNMDKVVFKKGSAKVKIEGQQCIFQTATSSHNGTNANAPVGTVVAVSQVKVIIAP